MGHPRTIYAKLFQTLFCFIQIFNILASLCYLCSWTDWLENDLAGNPEDRGEGCAEVHIVFIPGTPSTVLDLFKETCTWNNEDSQYRECSKISNSFLFLFSNKNLVIRAEFHKMFVRIANTEDPDQTASVLQKQSDLGLPCLSRPFVFEVLEHLFLHFMCKFILLL